MPARAQGGEELDAAKLKGMLLGLGYEVKDLSTTVGKESFTVPAKTEGFNVPLAAEISPSKRYIWLSASLGNVKPTQKHEALLKRNGKTQPVHFWITESGLLKVGLALENRQMTPAQLKWGIDKVATDVGTSAADWQ